MAQHERLTTPCAVTAAAASSRVDSSQASAQPVSIDSDSNLPMQESASMTNGSNMSVASLLLVIFAVVVMLIVSAVLMARAMKRRAIIKASFQDPWLGSPTVSYTIPIEESAQPPAVAVDPVDVESTSERDESHIFRRSQDSSFIRFSGTPWSRDSRSVRSLKASYWTTLYNQSCNQERPLETPTTEFSIVLVSTRS